MQSRGPRHSSVMGHHLRGPVLTHGARGITSRHVIAGTTPGDLGSRGHPSRSTHGYHAGQHTGPHAEIGRLLAHLEQRLAELDRLHHEIAEDAQALAHAAAASPWLATGLGLARCTRSVPPRPSWG